MGKEYWLIVNDRSPYRMVEWKSKRLFDFCGWIRQYGSEDIRLNGSKTTKQTKDLCKELVGKVVQVIDQYCRAAVCKIIYDYPCLRLQENIKWRSDIADEYNSVSIFGMVTKRTKDGTKLYKSGKFIAILEDREYTKEELMDLVFIEFEKSKNKFMTKLEKSTDLLDRLIFRLCQKYGSSMIYSATSFIGGKKVRAIGVKFKQIKTFFYIDKTALVHTYSLANGPYNKIDLADPKNDPIKCIAEIINAHIEIDKITSSKWR